MGLSPPRTGHAGRECIYGEVYRTAASYYERPCVTFRIADELYHNMRLEPGLEVLATAYDDPKRGGTGKAEPLLWTKSYGKGAFFIRRWATIWPR